MSAATDLPPAVIVPAVTWKVIEIGRVAINRQRAIVARILQPAIVGATTKVVTIRIGDLGLAVGILDQRGLGRGRAS